MIIRKAGAFTFNFPDSTSDRSQDEEWFVVQHNGHSRRLRVHDYDALYDTPGLYEALVYEALKCHSPDRVTRLFAAVLKDWPTNPEDLRVLDLGAGNGIVAEHLRRIGVSEMVGLDLLPEAEKAAERDRPDLYEDYVVADLCELVAPEEKRLRARSFNCLVTVAALGFGDIPPEAFATAFNFVEDDGWVVLTIKEDFLCREDDSGFARMLRLMINEGILDLQAHQRYCHRVSLAGEKLFYIAIVARKLRDVSMSLVQRSQNATEIVAPINGKGHAATLFGR
jgi:SAM-dependent methyltransferase